MTIRKTNPLVSIVNVMFVVQIQHVADSAVCTSDRQFCPRLQLTKFYLQKRRSRGRKLINFLLPLTNI